jgi:hypothetical protein
MVRVKGCGKSAPPFPRGKGHGKPHPEQAWTVALVLPAPQKATSRRWSAVGNGGTEMNGRSRQNPAYRRPTTHRRRPRKRPPSLLGRCALSSRYQLPVSSSRQRLCRLTTGNCRLATALAAMDARSTRRAHTRQSPHRLVARRLEHPQVEFPHHRQQVVEDVGLDAFIFRPRGGGGEDVDLHRYTVFAGL